MVRNSLRYASGRGWSAITRELKSVYTAKTRAEATDAYAACAQARSQTVPGYGRGPNPDLHHQRHVIAQSQVPCSGYVAETINPANNQHSRRSA